MTTIPCSHRWRHPLLSTRRSRKLSSAVRARVRAAENKSRCAKRIKKIGGGGGAQATLRPDVRAPFSPDPCAHRICFGHTGSSRPGGGTRKKTPPSFLRAAPLREQPARCSTARHATRNAEGKEIRFRKRIQPRPLRRLPTRRRGGDDPVGVGDAPRAKRRRARSKILCSYSSLSSTRRADGDVEKG